MMRKKERTLVLLKPDSVQRSLVGEIISRIERVGLKIVANKMVLANSKQIEDHYLVDPNWKITTGSKQNDSITKEAAESRGEKILEGLQYFLTSGPIIALVVEGAHAVPLTRKLVGSTEPLTSDVGTIRGDYVLDSYEMADDGGRAIKNLIHASSSIEDAEKEINVWFSGEEIHDYTTVHEKMLYE